MARANWISHNHKYHLDAHHLLFRTFIVLLKPGLCQHQRCCLYESMCQLETKMKQVIIAVPVVFRVLFNILLLSYLALTKSLATSGWVKSDLINSNSLINIEFKSMTKKLKSNPKSNLFICFMKKCHISIILYSLLLSIKHFTGLTLHSIRNV